MAGQNKRLNFVFRTDQPEGGEFGGELLIDNIRVYGFRPQDVDLDGDRDLADFAVMQQCFGGPLHGCRGSDCPPLPDECWAFDVNVDNAASAPDYGGDTAVPPQFKGFIELRSNPIVMPPTPRK